MTYYCRRVLDSRFARRSTSSPLLGLPDSRVTNLMLVNASFTLPCISTKRLRPQTGWRNRRRCPQKSDTYASLTPLYDHKSLTLARTMNYTWMLQPFEIAINIRANTELLPKNWGGNAARNLRWHYPWARRQLLNRLTSLARPGTYIIATISGPTQIIAPGTHDHPYFLTGR